MIPYTLDRRADTGVSNATLGFWLFLASEVMLYGALFSAYVMLRVAAPVWPSGREVLDLGMGGTNSVILTGAAVMTWRARRLPWRAARGWVAGGTILAAAFLAVLAIEFTSRVSAGLVPSRNTFLATYFTLAGIHALHVAGGAVANIWAAAGGAGEAMAVNRIRLMAWYWVCVDLVWLAIFVLLYL